jgi:hypothetical protein
MGKPAATDRRRLKSLSHSLTLEYQRYATSDFATLLAEARKFKISTFLSNQTLEQLDDLNRATALQVGSQVVFRVSGEDSKVLAPSFDTTPTPALVGDEPIRAPVADVVSHLLKHGSLNPVLAQFTSEYLMPLDALMRKVSTYQHDFAFGCVVIPSGFLIDAHRLLNDVLVACMRTGKADGFIPPLVLLILGGVANSDSTYVWQREVISSPFNGWVVEDFYDRAYRYGRPGFLEDQEAIRRLFLQHDKRGFFGVLRNKPLYAPAATAFLRMLRVLRATMDALATEPIMVDTGLFQPKYQLRTYQDQENLVANELSQLQNYHAKVRLLTGEHTIKTRPAPPLVPEQEIEARIHAIKQQMLRLGFTTAAAAVEEEVRKRHEALRRRPGGDTPQTNGNRRGRLHPPPEPA